MKQFVIALILATTALAQQPDMKVAVEGAQQLQRVVRDPDSLVIDHIYVNSKKSEPEFCYEYRARNEYGGMNREVVFYRKARLHFETELPQFLRKGFCDVRRYRDVTQEFKAAQTAQK